MKLTDVLPGSGAATSKLSRQVQKSGVAAGKKPRLELGVVGLSIGQTQSSGATSRVSEAALSPIEMIHLLEMLGEMMKEHGEGQPLRYEKRFGEQVAFNKEHAVLDAVNIYRNKNGRQRVLSALGKIAFLQNNTDLKEISATADAMAEEGITFQSTAMQVFEAAKTLHEHSKEVDAYVYNVNRIVDFLDEITDLTPDTMTYPFANAALKKLGLR